MVEKTLQKQVILMSGDKPGSGSSTQSHAVAEKIRSALVPTQHETNEVIVLSSGLFRRALALAWGEWQAQGVDWEGFEATYSQLYQASDFSNINALLGPHLNEYCGEDCLKALTVAQDTHAKQHPNKDHSFWDKLPDELVYFHILTTEAQVVVLEGKLATELFTVLQREVPTQVSAILRVFLEVSASVSAHRVLVREVLRGKREFEGVRNEDLAHWLNDPTTPLYLNPDQLQQLQIWKEAQLNIISEMNTRRILDDAERYAESYPHMNSEDFLFENREQQTDPFMHSADHDLIVATLIVDAKQEIETITYQIVEMAISVFFPAA
jgi:cytidylate kinase